MQMQRRQKAMEGCKDLVVWQKAMDWPLAELSTAPRPKP